MGMYRLLMCRGCSGWRVCCCAYSLIGTVLSTQKAYCIRSACRPSASGVFVCVCVCFSTGVHFSTPTTEKTCFAFMDARWGPTHRIAFHSDSVPDTLVYECNLSTSFISSIYLCFPFRLKSFSSYIHFELFNLCSCVKKSARSVFMIFNRRSSILSYCCFIWVAFSRMQAKILCMFHWKWWWR